MLIVIIALKSLKAFFVDIVDEMFNTKLGIDLRRYLGVGETSFESSL